MLDARSAAFGFVRAVGDSRRNRIAAVFVAVSTAVRILACVFAIADSARAEPQKRWPIPMESELDKSRKEMELAYAKQSYRNEWHVNFRNCFTSFVFCIFGGASASTCVVSGDV